MPLGPPVDTGPIHRSLQTTACAPPQPAIVREVPSTAPEASSACTATSFSGPGVAIAVSKPERAAAATGASCAGEGPASTRQLAVRVSPFQLAYTVTAPPAGWAGTPIATAGASVGAPVHPKR